MCIHAHTHVCEHFMFMFMLGPLVLEGALPILAMGLTMGKCSMVVVAVQEAPCDFIYLLVAM
jgi:hypothetical protein